MSGTSPSCTKQRQVHHQLGLRGPRHRFPPPVFRDKSVPLPAKNSRFQLRRRSLLRLLQVQPDRTVWYLYLCHLLSFLASGGLFESLFFSAYQMKYTPASIAPIAKSSLGSYEIGQWRIVKPGPTNIDSNEYRTSPPPIIDKKAPDLDEAPELSACRDALLPLYSRCNILSAIRNNTTTKILTAKVAFVPKKSRRTWPSSMTASNNNDAVTPNTRRATLANFAFMIAPSCAFERSRHCL